MRSVKRQAARRMSVDGLGGDIPAEEQSRRGRGRGGAKGQQAETAVEGGYRRL